MIVVVVQFVSGKVLRSKMLD